jgi:glycoside/pentoside/hexuronide:cation symporter, GPH family
MTQPTLPNTMPARPPLSVLWIYACGQLGWSLANYGVSSLLPYFYLPPEELGKAPIFPNFLPAFTFLGLTLLGILSFSGRLLDALIDPFVANLSDKSQHPFGKRRLFMALAALPLAVCSYLVFQPITEGGMASNAMGLGVSIFVFYLSFAAYVIPYSALISELGQVPEDRLRISTLLSITWALGYLLGSTTYALQDFFEQQGTPSVVAFQKAVGIYAIVAFVFLMIPVLFLNEKKYTVQGISHTDFWVSLKRVFAHPKFQIFTFSYLLYWLSLSFIQSGIIFYVTLLLGLDKTWASTFSAVSFVSSLLFYPFLRRLEHQFSKKTLVLTAFLVFCLIFIVLLLPISGLSRFWVIALTASFPLAIFGIFPNTFVADIVHETEQKTGENQAGMFYAVAAFMMKVGISLANLLFPSLIILGKSADNPLGVQLSVAAAFIFCLSGFWVFRKYEQ